MSVDKQVYELASISGIMHKRAILLTQGTIALATIFVQTQGYICWSCDAKSHEDCDRNGKFVHCSKFQDICSTEVRHGSGQSQIIKQCKQREACLNEQKQNWNSNHEVNECKGSPDHSVCRCCCFDEFCNRNDTCSPEIKTHCIGLPNKFAFGEMSCSDSNNVGSICNFQCTENDYVLFPSYSNQISCMANGKWSQPIPCCSESCPPKMVVDLIILIHFPNEERLQQYIDEVIKLCFNNLKHGEEEMHIAIIQYDDVVYPPVILLSDSEFLTNEQALAKVLRNLRHSGKENMGINTGKALWYIYNNIVGKAGDRPEVRNVLYIDTSDNSLDDVSAPAKALTDAGTLVYYNVLEIGSNVVNRTQAEEIVPFESHQDVWLVEQFYHRFDEPFGDFVHHQCQFSCPLVV